MELKIITKPFKGRPVGSVMDMNPAQAKLLVKIGRAQYMTRDMQAVGLTVDVPVVLPAEVEPEAPVVPVFEVAEPVAQDEPVAPSFEATEEPVEIEAPRRRGGRPRKAQDEE